jgi:hypothetical protein
MPQDASPATHLVGLLQQLPYLMPLRWGDLKCAVLQLLHMQICWSRVGIAPGNNTIQSSSNQQNQSGLVESHEEAEVLHTAAKATNGEQRYT